VLAQALARGHEVIGVCPDASRLATTGVTTVEGDARDPAAVEPAVVGADADLGACADG
jgi:putative NADH-flavin reductase